ncbi:MAG: shikimate kinase [Alphaproteobacteria bacterium]
MRRPKPRKSRSHAVDALKRPIVLVGLMGAGKSSIGRLVAARLGLEFVDADAEIESAAHASIAEIFETHGVAAFRSGERRVIERLLAGPVRVIATGGGAFMDNDTRRRIKTLAHSVWLKADLETLLKRVTRRAGRPLLKNKDPRAVLAALMAERDPVYAKADITVETSENPPAEVADRMIKLLESHIGVGPLAPAGKRGPSHGRAMGARGRGRGGAAAPPHPPRLSRRNRRAGSRGAKPQPGNRG